MSKRHPQNDEISMELGRRIRNARRRIGLSQQRVADLAGLERTTIGLIERGKRNMQTSTLLLICGAMEIDHYEIIGGIEFIAGPDPLPRSGTWSFRAPPPRG